MAEFASDLARHFSDLDDPRIDRTKRHALLDILVIAICATICGADGWTEVQAFREANEDWLRTFLELPNGIPSHDTFGRVFARLDPEQFQACFRRWVQALEPETIGQVVAFDGKRARRSHDRANGQGPLHLVSAWATDSHLVLGQRPVEAGQNEVSVLPELLTMLALEGCTVTIDAIACQAEMAQTIRDQGADYVLAVKDNLTQAARRSAAPLQPSAASGPGQLAV